MSVLMGSAIMCAKTKPDMIVLHDPCHTALWPCLCPSLSTSRPVPRFLSSSLIFAGKQHYRFTCHLRVQHATLKIVIESVVWHITYTQRVTAAEEAEQPTVTATATVTASAIATAT